MLSANVFADDWSEKTTIKEIVAGYKERIVLFTTTKPHHNPKGCESSYYAITEDDADLNLMLSMLLAAQRSGAEIQIGVDSSKCASISHAAGRINVTRIKSY